MDPLCSGDVGLTAPGNVHPCSRRPVPASVREQRRAALDGAVKGVKSDMRDDAEIVTRPVAGRIENGRAVHQRG